MTIQLKKSSIISGSKISISGSKSESNRLLILRALYPNIRIENISNADDSILMQNALESTSNTIDIHHAGTAMRFLTAYFSMQKERMIEITGSQRMKERPIEILVKALTQLGANIQYLENEGYPPVLIKGKALTLNALSVNANISSQYISALLLIAPRLENGIELTLKGEITSKPYIDMTLKLLSQIGVETIFNNNVITVKPLLEIVHPQTIIVESDWSSASYYYSIIALSPIGTEVKLTAFKRESFQGDSILAELYEALGVQTIFDEQIITLKKVPHNTKSFTYDLNYAPDIAQTVAVSCFALGIECKLTGLHTLKIKETDRLTALKIELEKLGANVSISEDSISLKALTVVNDNITITTYNDHRMAMAFAPLALKTNLRIENPEVVSKSYPNYWNDLKTLGFLIN